jgi:hypothetical protein
VLWETKTDEWFLPVDVMVNLINSLGHIVHGCQFFACATRRVALRWKAVLDGAGVRVKFKVFPTRTKLTWRQ